MPKKMTNKQFNAWVAAYFRSDRAAGVALGLDQRTVTRYRKDQSIPIYVELACAAYSMGIREFDGMSIEFDGITYRTKKGDRNEIL